MTTARMTVTGTEAGADYVELVCSHGRTAIVIDPPDSGDVLTSAMDEVQAVHRRDKHCDCERLVALLDGTERWTH
jgi:hypothetical protein